MDNLILSGYKFNSKEFYKINEPKDCVNDSYYYVSNDIINNITPNINFKQKYVLFGIANLHFFHCLANCLEKGYDFKRIIAVDFSLKQIKHAKFTIETILKSSSRIEFLETFYKIKLSEKSLEYISLFPLSDIGTTLGGEIGTSSKYKKLEENFWNSISPAENFNEDWELTKDGIKVFSNTIGDINKKYLTLFSCSRKDYDAWPFTIGWNSGFLRNEQIFMSLKQLLLNKEIFLIHDDITTRFNDLIFTNRYESIIFWSSNIFDKYFMDKHKNIEIMLDKIKYYSVQKSLPEINIYHIYDRRIEKPLNITFRNTFSIHTNSFKKVLEYMNNSRKRLEVVSIKEWIIQDNYTSKLPNTDYIYFDEFVEANIKTLIDYDCIFLHILLGHNIEEEKFKEIFNKAKGLKTKIIILEHNKFSKDFTNSNIFTDLHYFRSLCGKENKYTYCVGENDDYRNLLLEYIY